MKILLVMAHPDADSLSGQMARLAAARLKAMGHQVQIEDLYGQEFAPALTAQERATYYAPRYVVEGVREQAERLKEAEGLVLVFPTWWFGFPAILKGWFDRVWVPGVAYEHGENFGPIVPGLNRMKRVLAVTSLGAPFWVDRFVMGRPVRRVLKRGLLGSCAPGARLQFLAFYESERMTSRRFDVCAGRLERALESWR